MNVKPGDLAIVIGGTNTPEMIGNLVVIERIVVNKENVEISDRFRMVISTLEPAWLVRAVGSDGKIPFRDCLSGELFHLQKRAIIDRFLRPVSGLPDTEQTDQQEPIKEIA